VAFILARSSSDVEKMTPTQSRIRFALRYITALSIAIRPLFRALINPLRYSAHRNENKLKRQNWSYHMRAHFFVKSKLKRPSPSARYYPSLQGRIGIFKRRFLSAERANGRKEILLKASSLKQRD
jgi:hypothetical protein